MNDFLFRYRWKLMGIAIGAAIGFGYWYFIGCTSGTCPIQSHWQSSTLYGALIGYILPKNPVKKTENKESKVAEQK